MTRAAARTRGRAPGVAVLAAGFVLSACGASPAPVGPTGVDQLTIPTPSPDPADFSPDVDNTWFPLPPGTSWTYQRVTVDGSERLVATALPGTRRIDGVETRPVRWVALSAGGTTPLAVRWYAQDTAGNVWWFGQRLTRLGRDLDALATRSWQAGRAGAQAGLIMAASPRMGDGYANAYARGVVERRSTVLSLTATASVPARTYHDAVLTRDVSRIEPIHVARSYYAPGVGLVAQQTVSTTTSELFLVRRRP
jgi:hypothetical protein